MNICISLTEIILFLTLITIIIYTFKTKKHNKLIIDIGIISYYSILIKYNGHQMDLLRENYFKTKNIKYVKQWKEKNSIQKMIFKDMNDRATKLNVNVDPTIIKEI